MIIHHMSDGTIRKNIEGMVIPSNFKTIYILANKKNLKRKKEIQNGNTNTSGIIKEK